MDRVNTPDKRWHNGDPITGTPGTVVDEHMMNHFQEELCALVEKFGGKLDPADMNQIYNIISTNMLQKSGSIESAAGMITQYLDKTGVHVGPTNLYHVPAHEGIKENVATVFNKDLFTFMRFHESQTTHKYNFGVLYAPQPGLLFGNIYAAFDDGLGYKAVSLFDEEICLFPIDRNIAAGEAVTYHQQVTLSTITKMTDVQAINLKVDQASQFGMQNLIHNFYSYKDADPSIIHIHLIVLNPMKNAQDIKCDVVVKGTLTGIFDINFAEGENETL